MAQAHGVWVQEQDGVLATATAIQDQDLRTPIIHGGDDGLPVAGLAHGTDEDSVEDLAEDLAGDSVGDSGCMAMGHGGGKFFTIFFL